MEGGEGEGWLGGAECGANLTSTYVHDKIWVRCIVVGEGSRPGRVCPFAAGLDMAQSPYCESADGICKHQTAGRQPASPCRLGTQGIRYWSSFAVVKAVSAVAVAVGSEPGGERW